MNDSPRLGLPYIAPAQAQKHVTHNEALRRLDAIVQLVVHDRTQTSPPGEPEDGAVYIVAAPAAGAFAGQETHIAAWQDGAWAFIQPAEGWRAWVRAEGAFLVFDGTGWQPVVHPGEVRHSAIGVNTDADTLNRLSVKADSILFTHDDVTPGSGDMRATLNKAGAGGTAALLFQTGYSGRTEVGLAGDDRLRIKVSPDGTAWSTALAIDPVTGHTGIGTDVPGSRLTVSSGDGQYPTALDVTETGHATSARAAIGIGSWLIGQDSWGGGARDLFFYDGANAATRGSIGVSGGLVWGNPTGGDKGAGTINAAGVYDDNALLSCYVFDQALDGRIDTAKWDLRVPVPRAHPPVSDETGGTLETDAEAAAPHHTPMRRFRERIGTAYDPLTLDGYARHWKEKRHLTAMPNEASFDPEQGLATGAWIQRLIETAEIHAILIEQLNERTKPSNFKKFQVTALGDH